MNRRRLVPQRNVAACSRHVATFIRENLEMVMKVGAAEIGSCRLSVYNATWGIRDKLSLQDCGCPWAPMNTIWQPGLI
jgi:hypothetical protein